MRRLYYLPSVLALYFISQVGGSHFRGGTVSWTPSSNTTLSNAVEFTFRLAWRRDRYFCDQSIIDKRTLIGDSIGDADGKWTCSVGCTTSVDIESTDIYCTSYSILENWSLGERTFTHAFASGSLFTITFTKCCWIGVLGTSIDWSIQTSGSLNVRQDTGKANSSPVSVASPIVRLQLGCFYSLDIITDDPDGDEVRCRWAKGFNECGNVCNYLSGTSLQANPCVVQYNARRTGWYAVALTLEDFPKPPEAYKPLSQVPVQFLIEVRNFGRSCKQSLQFVPPTPVDRTCVAVPSGTTFRTTVAVTAVQGASLAEILLNAPVGTKQSGIHGNPPNQSVDIMWTPNSQQTGPHIMCFRALDNFGLSTTQHCLTILPHNSRPTIKQGTQTPNNATVNSSYRQHKFSVTFDQEIKRPGLAAFLYVLCRGANESVYRQVGAALDTSSSPAVTIHNRTLTFYVLFRIPSRSICHVEMDEGSVVGLQSCGGKGVPSEGISDQKSWTFRSGRSDVTIPCKSNGGRGACQFSCNVLEDNTYNCSCDTGYGLAINQHSCYKLTNQTDCTRDCDENGVCLGQGYCDCRFGWQGVRCDQPVCHNVADCSSHGFCISPNTCACKLGWSGPACSVDVCSIYSSCSDCSIVTGCGWCDSTRKCMAGSGHGPDQGTCNSWVYYRCYAASSRELRTLSGCSNEIAITDCNRPCVDDETPITKGPGSQQYCSDFKTLCLDYSSCFELSDDKCVSWNESKCPFGIILPGRTQRANRDADGRTSSTKKNQFLVCHGMQIIDLKGKEASGEAIVEETARQICESKIFPPDYGLLRRIAWVESMNGKHKNTFRDPNSKAGVGIWQVDKGTFEDIKRQIKLQQKYFKDINDTFHIDLYTLKREDLDKPLESAIVARLQLARFKEKIPMDPKEQARYWKKYYNSNAPTAKGTEQKFLDDLTTLPQPPSEDKGCKHGVRIPSNNCKCSCDRDFQGTNCDIPNCNCTVEPCSKNGICELSKDGKPSCRCHGRWKGKCCETCPPVWTSGDPHISTIDGSEFDFFGIGTFWSCISRENDFAVELAFFAYKHASVVGAAALKVGKEVATIVTVANASGADTLPPLRINGTLVSVQYGEAISLAGGQVTLYVNRGTNESSVVSYFFKYSHGATYNVEVRYSASLQRQYLNPAIGPPIAFIKQTKGLCGTMDDNSTNDFTGPDGTVYSDPVKFAESWRVSSGSTPRQGITWSWNASNFHRRDGLGNEYFDPSHKPQYDVSNYSSSTIAAANQTCIAQAVPNHLLDDCIFDVVVTGDTEFANQAAFEIGKCLYDCSNHGDCKNGTCICTGLWTGEDCSDGGCGKCPFDSRCKDGYCQCDFGYYPQSGMCIPASCNGVGDCTSPDNGRCQEDDVCLCNPGYIGNDCSQRAVCSDNCHGHGECTDGDVCICDPNWSGHRCDVPTCGGSPACQGHGNCTDQALCECFLGWTGSDCSLPSCVDVNNCSSRGTCVVSNKCLCQNGWTGMDCSLEVYCPMLSNCSGNGICLDHQTCQCFEGFAGLSCDFPLCPQGCSSQGRCVSAGFCECKTGWKGTTCNEPSCEINNYCSGHGHCIDYEMCRCLSNWTGSSCNVPVCSQGKNDSLVCSGRGDCIGPGVCACSPQYEGSLCEREAPTVSATSVKPTKPTTSDVRTPSESPTAQSTTMSHVRTPSELPTAQSTTLSHVRTPSDSPTAQSTPMLRVTIATSRSELVRVRITHMTASEFGSLKTNFRRAMAEVINSFCNDADEKCPGLAHARKSAVLTLSQRDVIVVEPVSEVGLDVMVSFYLTQNISDTDIIMALTSGNGLRHLKDSGFTLNVITYTSTPPTPEDSDDSSLTSGQLAAMAIASVLVFLLIVLSIVICFKRMTGGSHKISRPT